MGFVNESCTSSSWLHGRHGGVDWQRGLFTRGFKMCLGRSRHTASLCAVLLKMLNIQNTFINFFPLNMYISAPLWLFECWHVVRKTTTSLCINDVFSFDVMFLSRTHQDTSVFTLQKVCGQKRPRPRRQAV